MRRLYRLVRPAIFRLDPERSHGLSIAALKSGLPPALHAAWLADVAFSFFNSNMP